MTCKRKIAPNYKRSLAGLLVTALIGSFAFQISAISEAGAWTSNKGAVSVVAKSVLASNKKNSSHSYTMESVVDQNGNIFTITKRHGSRPTDVDPDLSNQILVGSETNAAASGIIHKLDPNGDLIWFFEVGGAGSQLVELEHVAIDSLGNVYAAGNFKGPMVLEGKTHKSKKYKNIHTRDLFAIKLDSDGDLKWVKVWGGIGDDYLKDIVVGPERNLFLVGTLQRGGYLDPESYAEWKDSARPKNDDDYFGSVSAKATVGAFVLKLNPMGGVEFAQPWGVSNTGGRGHARAFGVAVQDDGTVISAATFTKQIAVGTLPNGSPRLTSSPSSGRQTGLLHAIDGETGDYKWHQEFTTWEGETIPNGRITLGTDGAIYVGGTLKAKIDVPRPSTLIGAT